MKTIISGCTGGHANRRDFLRVGSIGALGISLSRYLELKSTVAATEPVAGQKARAQSCILLWLPGGPSQIDMWDPKPNSSFKPISTQAPGIQISELLPRTARHLDTLSIIRSVQTEEDNHPQGTYYAQTGHRPNPAMQFPSFGSIITKEMGPRNSVPAHVLVPQWKSERQYEKYFEAAFIGPQYNPMVVPDPSVLDFEISDINLPRTMTPERLQDRQAFLKLWDQNYRRRVEVAEFSNMDSFQTQALKIVLSPQVRDAFDLSRESEKTKEAYGKDPVGQSVLLARRLVEAGSRFVTASGYNLTKGWDTHAKNDADHRDYLAPTLDRTLSTLLDDLKNRGLLETTVVIAMGEFGRTPHLNPNLGRDHWWHCWSLVMGGGGIQGGQVVGASDDRGAYVKERPISMGDVYATIYKAFGIDWTKAYMTPIGRPIKIANSLEDKTGQPVKELVG